MTSATPTPTPTKRATASGGTAATGAIPFIVEAVCELLGMPAGDLLGGSRPLPLVKGRELAAVLLRRQTHMTYADISAALRRRSHTTVMYAALRGYDRSNRAETLETLVGEVHYGCAVGAIERRLHALLAERGHPRVRTPLDVCPACAAKLTERAAAGGEVER